MYSKLLEKSQQVTRHTEDTHALEKGILWKPVRGRNFTLPECDRCEGVSRSVSPGSLRIPRAYFCGFSGQSNNHLAPARCTEGCEPFPSLLNDTQNSPSTVRPRMAAAVPRCVCVPEATGSLDDFTARLLESPFCFRAQNNTRQRANGFLYLLVLSTSPTVLGVYVTETHYHYALGSPSAGPYRITLTRPVTIGCGLEITRDNCIECTDKGGCCSFWFQFYAQPYERNGRQGVRTFVREKQEYK